MQSWTKDVVRFAVFVHGLSFLTILALLFVFGISFLPDLVGEEDLIGFGWAAIIVGIASLYLTPFATLFFSAWLVFRRRDALIGQSLVAWVSVTLVSPMFFPILANLFSPTAAGPTIWVSAIFSALVGVLWVAHIAFGNRK